LRTYVKIEGKEIEPIVQELAKLAVNLPEVCVWDVNMLSDGWAPGASASYKDAPQMAEMGSYFGIGSDAFAKHCDRIISKSGANLEDAAIYYEWAEKPTPEQLRTLQKRIDDIVKPSKMKYKIINKE
jgi:hypothetical protein